MQLFASIYSLGGLSVAAGQWFQIWGYMESGEWCWIRANYPWMRMGLFYGPLVLVMALLVGRTTQALTISSKIRAAVEAAGADPSLRGQLPNSRKLHQHASLWFCLAFVACRLPSVVNRLSSSFEAGWNTELVGASLETDVSLMEMAHDFGSPLQGVAVAGLAARPGSMGADALLHPDCQMAQDQRLPCTYRRRLLMPRAVLVLEQALHGRGGGADD